MTGWGRFPPPEGGRFSRPYKTGHDLVVVTSISRTRRTISNGRRSGNRPVVKTPRACPPERVFQRPNGCVVGANWLVDEARAGARMCFRPPPVEGRNVSCRCAPANGALPALASDLPAMLLGNTLTVTPR